MDKSVYSVVLSDTVVAAIDRLATREGQSRSSLINQVLAAYAGLATPEENRREICAATRQAAERYGLRSTLTPAGTLTLHTALRYKYNPSMRYTIELQHGGEYLGEVRVSLRSQNDTLLSYVSLFFDLWARLEETHLPHAPAPGQRVQDTPHRYRRLLRRPAGSYPGHEAGEEIAAWVAMLDKCLHAYFGNLQDATAAIQATEAEYLATLHTLSLGLLF